MQLFIDLHCHSRFSADGVAEPEALIAEARAKGLHGFAITDHNTCACVDYFLHHGFMNKEGDVYKRQGPLRMASRTPATENVSASKML